MQLNLPSFWEIKVMNKQEYKMTKPSGYETDIFLALSGLINFVVYYIYAKGLVLAEESDMAAHAHFAEEFYLTKKNFMQAWLRVPYMLWHVCVKFFNSKMHFPLCDATAVVFAGFGVLCLAIAVFFIYKLTSYYTERDTMGLSILGGTLMNFVGPYAMWWFADPYVGQFSVNPFHNPTHMAVKSFGLLAVMIGIDLFREMKGEDRIFVQSGFMGKHMYLAFGTVLFLSTLTKPTFMYMLLPAGLIILLIELIISIVKRKGNVKNILETLLHITVSALPSFAYLILEYMAFYRWGNATNASTVAVGRLFEVWHFYTLNVPKSIVLGMFFPLWMVATNLRFYVKTTEGRLSLAAYAVGLLEFSLFFETGDRKDAGNFAWCMMAGMTVLFIMSVVCLIRETLRVKETKGRRAYIIASWFFLFLHVYSGLFWMAPFAVSL